MTNDDNSLKFKISFIGPKMGGKTSIIDCFHTKNFSTQVQSTIGASFISHSFKTTKGDITLHIWDTAGEERYKCLVPMYFRGSSVLVVVFDVTSRINFNGAKEWCSMVLKDDEGYFDVFVVGNKIDLQRVIPISEGDQFAKSINATYIETSAKTGENIDSLFNQIAETIAQNQDLLASASHQDISQQTEKTPSTCCS